MGKTLLRTGLQGGIRSTPTTKPGGSEFCRDASNVFSTSDSLRVRRGQVCRSFIMLRGENVCDVADKFYLGVAEDIAAASIPTSNICTFGAPVVPYGNVLFFGSDHPFNKLKLNSTNVNPAFTANVDPGLISLRFWYWNGTAFAQLNAQDCFEPLYEDSVPDYVYAPFVSTKEALYHDNVRLEIHPPDDWTAFDPDGAGDKWWFAIEVVDPSGELIDLTGVVFDHAASLVDPVNTDADNPLVPTTSDGHGRQLSLLTWEGRNNQPHMLSTILDCYKKTPQVTVWLDGVEQTQAGGVLARPTSETQRVWTFYHSQTDRVIGHIEGCGWFYMLPSSGDNNVYVFDAFNESGTVAADTNPFARVGGVLLTAIPNGIPAIHDARIFILDGNVLRWSAPSPYIDTFPARNRLFLDDNYGKGVGMASLGTGLLIQKTNAVYLVSATGEPEAYGAAIQVSGVGGVGQIISAGTIALIPCRDGVRMYDGETFQKISDQVDDSFIDASAPDLMNALSVFHGPFSQWRLFFPEGADRICSSAWYVDLAGWTPDSAGEKRSSMPIWPQGPWASLDHNTDSDKWPWERTDPLFYGKTEGFHATAVCEDETGSYPRTLIGSRGGNVYELDVGHYEWGEPVTAFVEQERCNIGSGDGVVLSGVAVSCSTDVANQLVMYPIPDGRRVPSMRSSVAFNRNGGCPSTSLYSGLTAGTTSDFTYETDNPALMVAAFKASCRAFSFRLETRDGGDLELNGFELLGNAGGSAQ